MARVLIIDDDAQLRTMLRESLEQRGYEVDEACDGYEGLRHYRATPPDVIILDIWMPEQEGLETLRALRCTNPEVKVIAISGGHLMGSVDFLRAAKLLGARRTLHKPILRHDLLQAVYELVQDAAVFDHRCET
ncbi:MAG TPA: response regulator [Candidatus Tectomicrobia bacterium]|jgi:CheY-like chemotaxis protein